MSYEAAAEVHDTEDKLWWTEHGSQLEVRFVSEVAPRLHLDAVLNPAKVSNPFVPDLLVKGRLADLKVQNTPFFTASRYGLDPQYTVTFNRKDYLRYSELYPQVLLFFWVAWTTLEWPKSAPRVRVDRMAGLWEVPFAELARRIDDRTAPLHSYQRRVGDRAGNATESYLFDARTFKALSVRP
jgi:hypothetical protein